MTSELFAAMTIAEELLAPQDGTLTHRENCLCPKARRTRPPVMLDERSVAPGLLNGEILETLAKDLEELGYPMVRTYVRRYNAAGEGIGPDMRIRECDAQLYYRVRERVLVAIERGADQQR